MGRYLIRLRDFYLLGIAILRKMRIIASLKVQSFFLRSPVDIQWSRAFRIGKNVKFRLFPMRSNKIRIGRHVILGDETLVEMRGGELILEDRTEFRRNNILKVDGRLHVEEGPAGLTYNCTIHCGKSIRIGKWSTVGEGSSMYDGEHIHTMDPDVSFYLHSENIFEPIDIGRNCYIGARCAIMRGVTIGDCAVIGSNSVVTKDIPGYTLSTGTPARVIKTYEPAKKKGGGEEDATEN